MPAKFAGKFNCGNYLLEIINSTYLISINYGADVLLYNAYITHWCCMGLKCMETDIGRRTAAGENYWIWIYASKIR